MKTFKIFKLLTLSLALGSGLAQAQLGSDVPVVGTSAAIGGVILGGLTLSSIEAEYSTKSLGELKQWERIGFTGMRPIDLNEGRRLTRVLAKVRKGDPIAVEVGKHKFISKNATRTSVKNMIENASRRSSSPIKISKLSKFPYQLLPKNNRISKVATAVIYGAGLSASAGLIGYGVKDFTKVFNGNRIPGAKIVGSASERKTQIRTREE